MRPPIIAISKLKASVLELKGLENFKIGQSFLQIGSMANVIAVQFWTINNIGDEHSVMVEHIGVEPMTSCMPCKRSSQLS